MSAEQSIVERCFPDVAYLRVVGKGRNQARSGAQIYGDGSGSSAFRVDTILEAAAEVQLQATYVPAPLGPVVGHRLDPRALLQWKVNVAEFFRRCPSTPKQRRRMLLLLPPVAPL